MSEPTFDLDTDLALISFDTTLPPTRTRRRPEEDVAGKDRLHADEP